MDREVTEGTKDGATEVPPKVLEKSFEFHKLYSDVAEIKAKQLVLKTKMHTII